MKTNKRAVFFLFLCVMGGLVLSIPASQSVSHYESVVYANEDVGDETEEDTAPETGSNGNYENLQVPTIMSTAYADGLRGAQQGDAEQAQVFKSNMAAIVNNPDGTDAIQFDTIGVLMGPLGQSSGSGTNDVASTLSMSLEQLKNDYSYGNAGEAYWTFGRAVQNLRLDAEKADTGTIGASAAIDAFAGVSKQVSSIGITLLKDWSPAPLVLAFVDNARLDDAEYADNELVKLVNDVPAAKNLVSFFGRPSGIAETSVSQLIMIVMIGLGLSVSILTVFLGERFFSVSVKKTFVKVLVMIIAVPLTMHAYDWGLDTLDAVAGDETQTTEYNQAEKHLLLGLWAERGFAVPSGVELEVQNDRFVLSRDDIRKINAMLLGEGTDQHETIANEISRRVSMDNNETNISWQSVINRDSGSTNEGNPWYTSTLIELANAVGNNQPIEEDLAATVTDNDIGYIYGSGLRASGSSGDFAYRQTGSHSGGTYTRFGLSPVASYNMLNTSFNSNGLSVKSNLSTSSTLPSVAPMAYAYSVGGAPEPSGGNGVNMPAIVRWLVEFVLLVASVKALARIITTGFGGMLHGGARSMFGASAGWGELLGAIFAAIFGVMGLSLISLIAFQVADVLYGTIDGLMTAMINDSGIVARNEALAQTLSPSGFLSHVPLISDPISDIISRGLDSLMATMMAIAMGIFLLPKFIKVPIEAFAGWISSLPNAWSQKAQDIENRFTGDYRAGGQSSGALGNAMANAGNGMLNSGTAVAAGAGMIAGAAVKAAGGAAANKVGGAMGKNKDGSGSDKENGSESVAGATAGGTEQTDENGNVISETISDNDQNTANENNQEGDMTGDDINADESANLNTNDAEGDTTGDDINSDESSNLNTNDAEGDMTGDTVTSDESATINDNDAEGDMTGDTVNADESATINDNDTEGDVNAEESANINANSAQGDVSGGEVNADGDSVATNDSTASGDMTLNDATASGDTHASNSAVAGDTHANNAATNSETSSTGDVTGGEVNANESTIGGETNANESVVGGETSTNESTIGGETNATGDAVNSDVNTSQSNVGGEAGGVNTETHSESTAAGGVNAGGVSVTNDATTEGNQVSTDASSNDANVNTNANANVTQSADARTMNQEGNADNRQNADVNSNTQTVNTNQNTNANTTSNSNPSQSNTSQKGVRGTGQNGASRTTGQKGVSSSATRSNGQSGNKGVSAGTTRSGGQTRATQSRNSQQTAGQSGQTGSQGATRPNSTKVSATMDKNGNVTRNGSRPSSSTQNGQGTQTAGRQGVQTGQTATRPNTQTPNQNSPRQQENTSQKAGRIGNIFSRGGANAKGTVSNRQQAAMGAVHVMGGLTGAQGLTQKGVDNMRRRQGKDVGGPQKGQTGSNQRAQNSAQNTRQQQIIDMERRDKEQQTTNKRPSFINQIRNKGNDTDK